LLAGGTLKTHYKTALQHKIQIIERDFWLATLTQVGIHRLKDLQGRTSRDLQPSLSIPDSSHGHM
jgi:hypothetical protein